MPLVNLSDWAIIAPFSAIMLWPAKTKSVVDYKIGVKELLAKSKEDIDKCCKGEYFMQLKYVDTKEEIIAINRKAKHIEPHLHNALEIVCVTSGTLELGVGQELYHMFCKNNCNLNIIL